MSTLSPKFINLLPLTLPEELLRLVENTRIAHEEYKSTQSAADGWRQSANEAKNKEAEARRICIKLKAQSELLPNDAEISGKLEEAREALDKAQFGINGLDDHRIALKELANESRNKLSQCHRLAADEFLAIKEQIEREMDFELAWATQSLVDLREISCAMNWDPEVYSRVPEVRLPKLQKRGRHCDGISTSKKVAKFATGKDLTTAVDVLRSAFRALIRT